MAGRPLRIAAVLLAATISSGSLVACGGSDDTVASIDGKSITKAEFDHLYAVAVRYRAGQLEPEAQIVIPDPPNFTKCIAAGLPTGSVSSTELARSKDEAKRRCQEDAREAKHLAMASLIEAAWLEEQARALKITVSDSEVAKKYEEWRQEQYPSQAALQQYFRESGNTKQDVLRSLRAEALHTKMLAKATSSIKAPSKAQIESYYRKHRREFTPVPAVENTEILIADSQAKAAAAKQALAEGVSFKKVTKKYSKEGKSGMTESVTSSNEDLNVSPSLARQIYAAGKGDLVGPSKRGDEWQIGRVSSVVSSEQKTLEGFKQLIEERLIGPRSERAIKEFEAKYKRHWKSLTKCNPGYVIELCANGSQ